MEDNTNGDSEREIRPAMWETHSFVISAHPEQVSELKQEPTQYGLDMFVPPSFLKLGIFEMLIGDHADKFENGVRIEIYLIDTISELREEKATAIKEAGYEIGEEFEVETEEGVIIGADEKGTREIGEGIMIGLQS